MPFKLFGTRRKLRLSLLDNTGCIPSTKKNRTSKQEVAAQQNRIFGLISRGKNTTELLTKATGWDKRLVRARLQSLLAQGRIQKVPKGYLTYYQIANGHC